jgi:hypothetical protein
VEGSKDSKGPAGQAPSSTGAPGPGAEAKRAAEDAGRPSRCSYADPFVCQMVVDANEAAPRCRLRKKTDLTRLRRRRMPAHGFGWLTARGEILRARHPP